MINYIRTFARTLALYLLVLVGLLFAAAANAAQFHAPNEGGGAMVVTDEPCVVGGRTIEGLHRAFSFIRTGESIEGCWAITGEDEVTIVWIMPDDTRVRQVYRASDFRKVTST